MDNMNLDLTAIIIAGIGGGGLLAQWMKFRYDMKKLSLDSKDRENEILTKAREEQHTHCKTQYDKIIGEVKTYFNEAKEKADKKVAKIRSMIYAVLHEVRIPFKFDRVYLLQPHPRNRHELLSVIYEVNERGVDMAMDIISQLKIKDYKTTVNVLKEREFIDITPAALTDKNTKSLFLQTGALRVFAVRLTDTEGEWVGTLVAEYTAEGKLAEVDALEIRELMESEGLKIKNILPDIL